MKKDKFVVTVSGSSGSSVELECYDGNLYLLGALLKGEGLGNRKVNWYSSDKTVGFVNRYGEFGAFKTGSCVVYAVDARYTKPDMDFDEVSTIVADESVPFVAWVIDVSDEIVSPQLYTFAVYSNDDNSLNFYSRMLTALPEVGDTFEGLTVTNVYTEFEDTSYFSSSTPWSSKDGNVESVKVVDSIEVKSACKYFSGFTSLKTCDITNLITNDISYMFYDCLALTNVLLPNTDKITTLEDTFRNCKALTDIDFTPMQDCTILWMNYAFSGCSSITTIDLTALNLDQARQYNNTFSNCSSLETINLRGQKFDSVVDITSTFENCTSLENIYADNDMYGTHIGENSYDYTFRGCTALTGGWGTTLDDAGTSGIWAVLDTEDTYGLLTDTEGVRGEKYTFAVYSDDDNSLNFYSRNLTALPEVGDTFNGVTVTDVFNDLDTPTNWFNYMTKVTNAKVIDKVEVASAYMYFWHFTSLKTCDLTNLITSDLSQVCYGCTSLTNVKLPNTDKVTNLNIAFGECTSLTDIDFTPLAGSTIVDEGLYATFTACSSLTNIDLSELHFDDITTLQFTFDSCVSLISINLIGQNFNNISSLLATFFNCNSLECVYSDSDLYIESITTDTTNTFTGCTALTGGRGTTLDDLEYTDNYNGMYAVIDTDETKGLLTKI